MNRASRSDSRWLKAGRGPIHGDLDSTLGILLRSSGGGRFLPLLLGLLFLMLLQLLDLESLLLLCLLGLPCGEESTSESPSRACTGSGSGHSRGNCFVGVVDALIIVVCLFIIFVEIRCARASVLAFLHFLLFLLRNFVVFCILHGGILLNVASVCSGSLPSSFIVAEDLILHVTSIISEVYIAIISSETVVVAIIMLVIAVEIDTWLWRQFPAPASSNP
mmetsp:Transcript_7991/g.17287  ORF Transcript_7991/g.17287 Transcript_7991/m.17287 type:complete len:220 (+) Transcript_7991:1753-2412(+)